MEDLFINSPPHPEKEWASCTAYSPDARVIQPLMDEALQDISVCKGENGWYMIGAASDLSAGREAGNLRIWASADMKTWECLGELKITEHETPLLSPKLHALKSGFYLSCGLKGGGTALFKSAADPKGPYVAVGKMTHEGSDASMFEDVDGEVYWIVGDGSIARMNPQLDGLTEALRPLPIKPYRIQFRKDRPSQSGIDRIGSSGASVAYVNGQYLLLASDQMQRMGSESSDTFVAIGESLYGPYSRRYLLIPHGGRASVFAGEAEGSIFAAFTGSGEYSAVEGKVAIVELEQVQAGFFRPAANVILEKGPVAVLKPAADFLIRDPQICLAPNGIYYMTGTTNHPHDDFWDGNDEFHVWQSLDLDNWTHVGKVWDLHEDGTWQNAIRERPCVWAPEICFIKDTFWITYSLKGGSTGLLKSISGKAEGPYVDMGRMTNRHIDSSLFADDGGEVYYVWQDGLIARMKADLTGFAEEPRKLLTIEGTTVGYEGAFIVKYKGKYLLGAAEWNGDERIDGTYDLMVAVSDSLYGPYSSSQVAVPHGGHGTMFVNRDGELMSTLFGNDRTAPFRTKPGIVKLAYTETDNGVSISPCRNGGEG